MGISIIRGNSEYKGLCANCLNRDKNGEIKDSEVFEIWFSPNKNYSSVVTLCRNCLEHLCEYGEAMLHSEIKEIAGGQD